MKKKVCYVVDTCVVLHDVEALSKFKGDVILALQVLNELDRNKIKEGNVGFQARSVLRKIDELCRDGKSLNTGVKLGKGLGTLYVKDYSPACLPSTMSLESGDMKIIATALTEKFNNPDSEVIVVSRDIAMRIIADSVGLKVENYDDDKTVISKDESYTGEQTIVVPDATIDAFYRGDRIYLDKLEYNLTLNEFVTLQSEIDPKKTALTRYMGAATPLRKIYDGKTAVWGVKPRNKQQAMFLELIMDPSVELVCAMGTAGSGKSLLSLAGCFEQVLGSSKRYEKICISKSLIVVGGKTEETGFLPGNLNEKLSPVMGSIKDNCSILLGDEDMFEQYVEEKVIELIPISMIRGRSLAKSIVIIEEAQNITRATMKTILTRIGEGSKIILIGCVEQIDNTFINEFSNGLSVVADKMKGLEFVGVIKLPRGERSKIANFASERL